MAIFNLPDLGEGLPDAEIREWYVKEGDSVILDQPLVSMETAKAVVDVPCPQSGIIEKLYGKPADVIQTGSPLAAFKAVAIDSPKIDKGTVVGNLEENADVSVDNFVIGSGTMLPAGRARATPQVRQLAKKLGVDISVVSGTGQHGIITKEDVEKVVVTKNHASQSSPPEGFIPLRGSRRAMLHTMVLSHSQVVPVSIFDEADIHAWAVNEDITVRLIQAIQQACKHEPALNAWFDTEHEAKKCFNTLNLGIAMDTEEGLFVPVIHDVERHSSKELRDIIDTYKQEVNQRSLVAEKLSGATFTLSNFGKFAGRFASPIVVPPMVAILAVGRVYEGLVMDKSTNSVEVHRLLPLSLSFDHRAATGGEAARFLGAVIDSLA